MLYSNQTKLKSSMKKISINPCCIWLKHNQNHRKLNQLQSILRWIKKSASIHVVFEPNKTKIKHEKISINPCEEVAQATASIVSFLFFSITQQDTKKQKTYDRSGRLCDFFGSMLYSSQTKLASIHVVFEPKKTKIKHGKNQHQSMRRSRAGDRFDRKFSVF